MKDNKLGKKIAFFLLLAVCIIWLFPLIWAVFTSFKPEMEIQATGFSLLPQQWTLANYLQLMGNESSPVFRWFVNSLIFSLLLGTMMFPTVMNLIPNFKIIDMLGWTNTFMAVIVPGAAGVYNIFLVRQFILGIPKELDESAVVDGANEFQIFYYIILPLIKPVLTVVALFSFTSSWNDFLWPSIVINDIDKLPITPGLQLLQGQYLTYPGIGAAVALLALVPTFALYLVAQKSFMKSMSLQSGIK
ncbi:N-acetyl-D-glucosamine ABC transporter permease [Enterococcus faecium UC8668]|uniref:carbohydrate ABC transporter permease n=1 Tax=Enterococcus faecium TaxID=1352 RepID=UPI0004119BFE|nr:carbohydrate ABC transporter permease [Enterococcus faecium]KEI50592.1 N-acetyl-D-glucosamine ABC transporter permease [Enterococcus faecium UC8668]